MYSAMSLTCCGDGWPSARLNLFQPSPVAPSWTQPGSVSSWTFLSLQQGLHLLFGENWISNLFSINYCRHTHSMPHMWPKFLRSLKGFLLVQRPLRSPQRGCDAPPVGSHCPTPFVLQEHLALFSACLFLIFGLIFHHLINPYPSQKYVIRQSAFPCKSFTAGRLCLYLPWVVHEIAKKLTQISV